MFSIAKYQSAQDKALVNMFLGVYNGNLPFLMKEVIDVLSCTDMRNGQMLSLLIE